MAPLVLEHRSLNRAQNKVTKSGNKKTTLNSLMNQAEVSIKIKQPSKKSRQKNGKRMDQRGKDEKEEGGSGTCDAPRIRKSEG